MLETIVNALFHFVSWIIAGAGYGGIVALMAIESACIPLPSELIMPFAGYLVYTGHFDLIWVATAGALGCNVGSVFAYEIGYYGGRPLVERYGRYILLTRHDLELSERFFSKYGSATIFVGRLLPLVRTFIALPAGVARMPRMQFHIYTFLGSWPWCFMLAYLGMKLAEHWRRLGAYIHEVSAVVAVLLMAGFAWYVYTHWKYRVGGPLDPGAS